MTILFKFCATPPNLSQTQWIGPAGAHPLRQAAHTASKLALALAYREFSLLSPRTELHDYAQSDEASNHEWWLANREHLLEEANFYCLKKSPDTLISRAHTDQMTVGAVAELGLGVRSIGIDIEDEKRVLKPELAKIFLSSADQAQSLSLLEIWSAKEAIYKALSSFLLHHQLPVSKPLTLKDIELTERQNLAGQFRFKDFEGLYLGQKININNRNYLVFTASLFA